jgi:hypothetical protein
MAALTRPIKITFAEMRAAGVRGILIYCSDYKCSHSIAISADQWPDHVRLSDLEARFVCKACGKRGADVRPDFNWNKQPVAAMVVPWSARGMRDAPTNGTIGTFYENDAQSFHGSRNIYRPGDLVLRGLKSRCTRNGTPQPNHGQHRDRPQDWPLNLRRNG